MSDRDDIRADVDQMTEQMGRLTQRVYLLERTVTMLGGEVPFTSTSATVPARPAAPQRRAPERVAPPPAAPRAPRQAAPPPPAARTPYVPPRPPREPINWPELAARAFTARTLAWAGGVATALGVVLLFIVASSRGWITPGMRVGTGVLVSLGVLAAALEFDRRKWRADAILAAAGAGIAGLYASLWAAVSAYHLVGRPLGLALAALIAATAVACAIRIREEPLAIFGIVAAMAAPVLVAHDVTGDGALFALIIACAGLPLLARYGWELLTYCVWATALIIVIPLYVSTGAGQGFTSAVAAGAGFFCLFTAEAMVTELRKKLRRRISELSWLLLGSSIPAAFAASFVYGGERMVMGHRLTGIVLLGVALAYAGLAVVPVVLKRRHADLEDVLGGFGLAALATATGLLVGGPGMVCAWAAESVVLVALSERLLGRSGTRRARLTLAAGAYLALATGKAALLTWPIHEHLPTVGSGSRAGSVALGAVLLAGLAYCYGTRFVKDREVAVVWAVPAAALGYLPLWALSAEWAVCAYALLAAGVFAYRRSPWMVTWFDDRAAVLIGIAYGVAGIAVAGKVAAPLHDITHGAFGARQCLLGLALLVASGCVAAWSLRRPRVEGVEYAALVPAALLGYLICEAVTQHQAMWAALGVSAVAAASVHVPQLRRRVGEGPLLAIGAGYLGSVVYGLLHLDQAGGAVVHHGQSEGWGTLAVAVGVAFLLATGVRDPRRRAYAMWLPAVLLGWLATLVLPGQYPLVAWAGISVLASAVVIWQPEVLSGRIDLRPLREMAALVAAGDAVIVLAGYETPHMLFTSNHTPAGGLAAAVAAVVALGFARGERSGTAGARRAVDARQAPRLDRCLCRHRCDGAVDAGRGHPGRVPAPGRLRRSAGAERARPLPAGSRRRVRELGADRSGAGGAVTAQRAPERSDRRDRAAVRGARQALPVRPHVPDRDRAGGQLHHHRIGAADGGAPPAAVLTGACGARRRSPGGHRLDDWFHGGVSAGRARTPAWGDAGSVRAGGTGASCGCSQVTVRARSAGRPGPATGIARTDPSIWLRRCGRRALIRTAARPAPRCRGPNHLAVRGGCLRRQPPRTCSVRGSSGPSPACRSGSPPAGSPTATASSARARPTGCRGPR